MFSLPNHIRAAAILVLPAVLVLCLRMGAEALSLEVVEAPAALPPGTILPLQLQKTISLKDAQKGLPIEAKIMQEIPFSKGEGIPVRSVVRGSVVSIEKDQEGPGQKLTLKFEFLEAKKETLPVSAYLRAIASMRAVEQAQTSNTGSDSGTPAGWTTTILIGGDRRFGDGGDVRDRAKEKVGKGVRGGGVLLHVRANPALGCEGATNMEDLPQAFWVFSSNACGVYDLEGMKIAHTGKGAPVGEITLHFEKDDMKIFAGTAFLLRVAATPPQPSKP
jgi:hypothetical protein